MKNGVIDVRPKLLQDVEDAIQRDLRYPYSPGGYVVISIVVPNAFILAPIY